VGTVLALWVLILEGSHPADRLVVDLDAEVLVDARHLADRVGGQVVVVDIEEPVVAHLVTDGQATVQPHLLERAPFGAEPLRVEQRAVHRAQGPDEAHARRDDLGRVPVRPDDAGIGVDLEQRV
jgi:hypothetical protein